MAKKRAVHRRLKEILVNARTNGVSLDLEIESLILFLDEQLEQKEEEIMEELKRRGNPVVKSNLVEELWEIYPQYLSNTINGNRVPAKGLAGHTMEQLEEFYCKNIHNSLERHNQIKQLVKWGEKNELISTNFGNFIYLRRYEALEADYLKNKKTNSDLI